MDTLTDRVAVVTGAGEGIGRGIALALAEAGAHIAIADIHTEAAKRVATELAAAGRTASPFYVDVADPVSLTALAEEVQSSLGPASILCNNAGVMLDGPLTEVSPADWQWVLDVNLHGVINGVRAFIDQLQAAASEDLGAQIVNTGSMAGLAPRTYLDYGIYSASKAAVIGFTKSVAADYIDRGIRCNAVCPGTVDTPSLGERIRAAAGDEVATRAKYVERQPMGRLGKAGEIAQACLYLASDEAVFMTGAEFVIDGGMVL